MSALTARIRTLIKELRFPSPQPQQDHQIQVRSLQQGIRVQHSEKEAHQGWQVPH